MVTQSVSKKYVTKEQIKKALNKKGYDADIAETETHYVFMPFRRTK